MIIARFCDSSKEYIEKINYFFAELKAKLRSGALVCRKCQCRFGVNSYYERHLIEDDGIIISILIMQIKCLNPDCGKTESVLPDFVMPFKLYSVAVIESVLLEYEKSGTLKTSICPAENSTIYKWLNYFRRCAEIAFNNLCAIFYKYFDSSISFVKMIELSLFERIKVLLGAFEFKHFDFSVCPSIISAANVILSRYGSGYI